MDTESASESETAWSVKKALERSMLLTVQPFRIAELSLDENAIGMIEAVKTMSLTTTDSAVRMPEVTEISESGKGLVSVLEKDTELSVNDTPDWSTDVTDPQVSEGLTENETVLSDSAD